MQGEYLLNKDYIARVLCENKNKPAMHCDGKCYLKKKLTEDQNQDQQAPTTKKERVDVTPFFVPTTFYIETVAVIKKVHYSESKAYLSNAYLRSVFHPPTV